MDVSGLGEFLGELCDFSEEGRSGWCVTLFMVCFPLRGIFVSV